MDLNLLFSKKKKNLHMIALRCEWNPTMRTSNGAKLHLQSASTMNDEHESEARIVFPRLCLSIIFSTTTTTHGRVGFCEKSNDSRLNTCEGKEQDEKKETEISRKSAHMIKQLLSHSLTLARGFIFVTISVSHTTNDK